MIYFQYDGSPLNLSQLNCYRNLDAVSPYFKGESSKTISLKDPYEIEADSLGLKVIDFSVFRILADAQDINKANYLNRLLKVIKRAVESYLEHELLIIIPHMKFNDDISVRSDMLNELRVVALRLFKISKSNTVYQSHRSNPMIFHCDRVVTSFNTLDEDITNNILSLKSGK